VRAGGNHEEAAVNGYVVVVERAEDGTFGAWSPDLPGVVATAQSYEECVDLMREAVAGHLEVMREHGDPVPEPRAIGALTITAA
jgi:predicted RNase H-like HicB family nuclease